MSARVTRRRRSGHGEQGFSLLEVLVTLSLMVTLLLVFSRTLVAADRVAHVERQESQAIDDLSTAMQRLERELRWTDQLYEPTVANAATSVETRKLRFRTRGGSGVSYEVTYELAPSGDGKAQLQRTEEDHATITLAESLVDDAAVFTYYPPQPGDQYGYFGVKFQVQLSDARDPRWIETRITARNLV